MRSRPQAGLSPRGTVAVARARPPSETARVGPQGRASSRSRSAAQDDRVEGEPGAEASAMAGDVTLGAKTVETPHAAPDVAGA